MVGSHLRQELSCCECPKAVFEKIEADENTYFPDEPVGGTTCDSNESVPTTYVDSEARERGSASAHADPEQLVVEGTIEPNEEESKLPWLQPNTLDDTFPRPLPNGS